MKSFQFAILIALTVVGFQASPSAAFTATSRCQKLDVRNGRQYRSLSVLNSSQDPNDENYDPNMDADASMSVPETPATYVPPTPTRNSPPAVRQKRMDPLMASLTRDDSSPDQPTTTVPFLGEIPADGSMMLLGPAVVFAVLGFVFSIVIAFNSSDQIVDSIAQTGESIAQTAQNRNNRVYDKDVCRGLCSSQEKDVDGMRNFMEAITRSARENQKSGDPAEILGFLSSQESAPITSSPIASSTEETQAPVQTIEETQATVQTIGEGEVN